MTSSAYVIRRCGLEDRATGEEGLFGVGTGDLEEKRALCFVPVVVDLVERALS